MVTRVTRGRVRKVGQCKEKGLFVRKIEGKNLQKKMADACGS